MSESIKHIERCVDIIQADKNVSEETIKIMFIHYKGLVIKEYINQQSKQYKFQKK
jgi:hypothetical protein